MVVRPIHPAWGIVEIAALAMVYLTILWIVGPRVAFSHSALAIYWVALAASTALIVWISPIILHRDPPGLRGWGMGRSRDDPGTVRNAWPAYLALTAGAALILLIVVTLRDPAFIQHRRWWRVGHKLLIYMVFGPIQAMIVFGYLHTRLRTAIDAAPGLRRGSRPLAALGTSLLFAACHAPNWPLAGLSFAIALCWSWLYHARPNVLLTGMSHAVLGTLVYSVLGLYTRIGPFYAHPEGHIIRNAIPGLKALVGDLF